MRWGPASWLTLGRGVQQMQLAFLQISLLTLLTGQGQEEMVEPYCNALKITHLGVPIAA